MTSRSPPEGSNKKPADELTEDDPIPEEVHRSAEALAKAVLAMPPKPLKVSPTLKTVIPSGDERFRPK